MQRSLQLQLLSFLAGLSTLGAVAHPTFDTILFATAFVFGTLLLHVRERLEHRRGTTMGAIGKVIGAALPWGLAALRAWSPMVSSKFPPRLTAAMLVAAAIVPTGILLVDAMLAMRGARGRRERAAED